MLLSREAEYAIQALLKLASYTDDSYVSILSLSEDLNIPFFYLSKILQKLVKQGVLKSHKGPKGGVAFAVKPEETSILDIVITIDGDKFFDSCVLGLHKCDSDSPCPLHEQWTILRESIRRMFGSDSLATLGRDPELIRRAQLLKKSLMEAAAAEKK